MLTFFRRIRKTLLNSGSAGKYALYAVGEILLVVVGILIALQINNWNEHRIDRKRESHYLFQLCAELKSQQLLNDAQLTHEAGRINLCESALQTIQLEPIDVSKLNEALNSIGRKTFIVSNSIYEEIKSNGELSLIRNDSLRNEVVLYYQYADYIEKATSNINSKWVDGFEIFLLDHLFYNLGYNQGNLNYSEYDMSIAVEKLEGLDDLISSQLSDLSLKAKLYNHLISRGRVSRLISSMVVKFNERTNELIEQIEYELRNLPPQ